MTARGSKSARTPKAAKTPAQDAAPEVKIDAGTTVVLPNPADAPAPPKTTRTKKAAPTVAEVPGLGRSAPPRATRPPRWPRRPRPRRWPTRPPRRRAAPRRPRPSPRRTRRPPPRAGSLRAIGDAWLDSLRAAGHTPSTVSSYGNDLAIAYDALRRRHRRRHDHGEQIAAFNASKGVVKKANGKPKAQPTILKTRRALRLALVWAEQKKLIAKAPYSAKTPA